jgi:hypothetical protein
MSGITSSTELTNHDRVGLSRSSGGMRNLFVFFVSFRWRRHIDMIQASPLQKPANDLQEDCTDDMASM